jgi:hypothetical protein
MVKRQAFVSWVLLIVIVFAVGIIVGRSGGNPELSDVNLFIKQSELTTESYLIEQELLAGLEKDCNLAQLRLSGLSGELAQLGELLGTETAKQDLGESNYNFLKRKFHLMQIKTYTLYHRLRQDCAVAVPIVLFYYGARDTRSDEQGAILDRLVREQDIKVFAIEHNYSSEISFLEEYYDITRTPAVVVNFETMHQGLTPYDQLAALVREE